MSISRPARSGLAWRRRCSRRWLQDYVRAHGWGLERPEGRMIALLGDAELDEGNIFEAMLEGWKQGLRNCWWIVDYNRQSLDAVVREGSVGALRESVPQFRLGRRRSQIRRVAAGSLRRAGRRGAAAMDRSLSEPALFGAGVPGRRGVAQALARRDRRPGSGHAADRVAQRRRAGAADEQSRRPRPRCDHRRVRRHRSRPAGLLHRLHDQGLWPAVCRPQGQSRRPDDAGADGDLSRGDEHRGPGTSGTASRGCGTPPAEHPGVSRPRAVRQSRRAPLAGAAHRGAGELCGHDAAEDVDADSASARCSTNWRAATRRLPRASSPPRPT